MEKNILSPILLFVYKRVDTLIQTVTALQNNFEASDSDLFIFSDAPKSEKETEMVDRVRSYIKTIKGFNNIHIIERRQNYGLAKSVIEGVTEIINKYGKVIVLEDDLVSSPNFLSYMNNALDYYKSNDKIFSIAGYTAPIKTPLHDVYFTLRASSWGWGIWEDRWGNIDWDLENQYANFIKNKDERRQFNKMGSDMTKMLRDQMTGKINSWAVRWCYNQFLMQKYSVYPTVSKIINIGTDEMASNTKDRFNRFFTPIDKTNKTEFTFINDIKLDDYYLNQFLKQYNFITRIKYKILNKLL